MIIFFIVGIILVIAVFSWVTMRVRRQKNSSGEQEDTQAKLKILERDPSHIEALEHLSKVRYDEKKYDQAYHYCSRLIVAVTNSERSLLSSLDRFQMYLIFGISAYHIGEKGEALTSLQKARLVLNNTETFDLFYYIGLIHFERSDYMDASSALQAAYEQSPKHKENAKKLAICYYNLGKFGRALPLLEELQNTNEPSELDFYYAVCLVELNKHEAALNILTAVAQKPKYKQRCWYEMGKIYLKQGLSNKALEICQSLINMGDAAGVEELSFAYYNAAKILAKMGSLDKATAMLNELLKFNSSYADTISLQKRYSASQDCPQLFRLQEGDEEVRRNVAIKLVGVVVPDSQEIEFLSEQSNIFEISALNQENKRKYYVWICLQDNKVTMRQVFHAHVNSKQYGCSHCVMGSLSGFEQDTESYIKGRPITLMRTGELKEYINQVSG